MPDRTAKVMLHLKQVGEVIELNIIAVIWPVRLVSSSGCWVLTVVVSTSTPAIGLLSKVTDPPKVRRPVVAGWLRSMFYTTILRPN